MKLSAIMLAAGLSRRMGRDKLLLPLGGETIMSRAVNLLLGLPVYERILVTSAERLKTLELPGEIIPVINPSPERGQSESVKLGVAAATGDMYMFLAADQPGLTPAGLQFLLDAAEASPDKIIFPAVRGGPVMPSLFPARFREDLLRLTGDSGGRALREKHPGEVLLPEAANPDAFADIDTEKDYFEVKVYEQRYKNRNKSTV